MQLLTRAAPGTPVTRRQGLQRPCGGQAARSLCIRKRAFCFFPVAFLPRPAFRRPAEDLKSSSLSSASDADSSSQPALPLRSASQSPSFASSPSSSLGSCSSSAPLATSCAGPPEKVVGNSHTSLTSSSTGAGASHARHHEHTRAPAGRESVQGFPSNESTKSPAILAGADGFRRLFLAPVMAASCRSPRISAASQRKSEEVDSSTPL